MDHVRPYMDGERSADCRSAKRPAGLPGATATARRYPCSGTRIVPEHKRRMEHCGFVCTVVRFLCPPLARAPYSFLPILFSQFVRRRPALYPLLFVRPLLIGSSPLRSYPLSTDFVSLPTLQNVPRSYCLYSRDNVCVCVHASRGRLRTITTCYFVCYLTGHLVLVHYPSFNCIAHQFCRLGPLIDAAITSCISPSLHVRSTPL